MESSTWSIKNLMGPIITRIIAYGANPIDIEKVINKLETAALDSARNLENSWWNEWDTLAQTYLTIASKAESNNNFITAREMYFLASSCYYATSLINYATIEQKKQAYMEYVKTYKQCTRYFNTPINAIEIPCNDKDSIPGYIHFPQGEGPFPCVIILTGIGTSKEETHFSAQPFVQRGIASVTIDIPGIGESLFCRGLKFNLPEIKSVVSNTIRYLQSNHKIEDKNIGIYGICMGGTLAYRIASTDKRITFCATSFPLRLEKQDREKIPLWIKTGKWYNYFSGGMEETQFLQDLSIEENEIVRCPYFLIHGKYDNWTSLEHAMELYNKASGMKELLIIEDKPAITGGNNITHMMPVGEQYHWIKHIIADWIKNQVKGN